MRGHKVRFEVARLSIAAIAVASSLILGSALAASARTPPATHVKPQAVDPFPAGSGPAFPHAGSSKSATGASTTGKTSPPPPPQPGTPAVASLELKKGKHIGYQFDARGRAQAKSNINISATRNFGATRTVTVAGATYYLLDWGQLANQWVKLDVNTTVIATTGWKELAIVFRNDDLSYADSDGTTHALQATMSDDHVALMVGAVQQLPMLGASWSANLVAPQLTVVEVQDPIHQLTDLGNGNYWLGPWDVKAAVDALAPAGTYDSIVAIWQPWDGTSIVPSPGWGLSIDSTPDANGAAWSTITVPPPDENGNDRDWWISSSEFPGEVFAHEWLHNVSGYYTARGVSIPDLHATDYYRYTTDSYGSWWRWYTDYLRQQVLDPKTHAYAGIPYTAWQIGTPSTRP